MARRVARHVLKENTRIKLHKRRVLHALLAPPVHIPGTQIASCVHWVVIALDLEMVMRVARYARQAHMQTLEVAPTAKHVLKGDTKTRWVSIHALPANQGATQIRRGEPRLVSFVRQGNTRQAMVPKLDAHNVMLENTKIRQGRVGVLTVTLAGTASMLGKQHAI